jgi:hypothetical protein
MIRHRPYYIRFSGVAFDPDVQMQGPPDINEFEVHEIVHA